MNANTVSVGKTVNTTENAFLSTIRSRNVIESPPIYTSYPLLNSVPQSLKMDFSRLIDKPFLVRTLTVSSADTPLITHTELAYPSVAFNNAAARAPFALSSLHRTRACVYAQIAGTPQHQGTYLLAVVPTGFSLHLQSDINALLNAPHAFLHCNENTSVCVEIPFYYPGFLAPSDSEAKSILFANNTSDYANIVLLCVNPVGSSGTASTSLTASIFIAFKDSEFYVPTSGWNFVAQGFTQIISTALDGTASYAKHVAGDFIDTLRGSVKKYTGLHNPTIPNQEARMLVAQKANMNSVEEPVRIQRMDPFSDFRRITRDTTFDTTQDEMDMNYVLSKPQFIGTATVNNTDTVGTPIFSFPIAPRIPPAVYSTTESAVVNNFALFHTMSRAWRGSLKLYIQSNMTNFHFMRVALLKSYYPTMDMFDGFPNYNTIHNGLVDYMEFSAGGQVQEIDLPYAAETEYLECAADWKITAMQHGMVYLYIHQPLVNSASVPTSVKLNFYLSAGPDFHFAGYSPHTLNRFTLNPALAIAEEETDFEPQSETSAPDQKVLLNNRNEIDSEDLTFRNFRPITNVRDYIRRWTPAKNDIIAGSTAVTANYNFYYKVNDLLGFGVSTGSSLSTLAAILDCYHGIDGGLRIKLLVRGVGSGVVRYIPPGSTILPPSGSSNTNRTVVSTSLPNPISAMATRNSDRMSYFNIYNPYYVPLIDFPDYRNLSPNMVTSNGSTSYAASYASDHCEFEFEIPNMNFFRFISDPGKRDASSDHFQPGADLGYIHVAFPAAATQNSSNTLTYRALHLQFYVAATDETRLGYHVYSPNSSIPAVSSGGQNILDTLYSSGYAFSSGDLQTSTYPLDQGAMQTLKYLYYIKLI